MALSGAFDLQWEIHVCFEYETEFCFVQPHSFAFNRFVMRECWFGVKNRGPRPGSVSVANSIRKQNPTGQGKNPPSGRLFAAGCLKTKEKAKAIQP